MEWYNSYIIPFLVSRQDRQLTIYGHEISVRDTLGAHLDRICRALDWASGGTDTADVTDITPCAATPP